MQKILMLESQAYSSGLAGLDKLGGGPSCRESSILFPEVPRRPQQGQDAAVDSACSDGRPEFVGKKTSPHQQPLNSTATATRKASQSPSLEGGDRSPMAAPTMAATLTPSLSLESFVLRASEKEEVAGGSAGERWVTSWSSCSFGARDGTKEVITLSHCTANL